MLEFVRELEAVRPDQIWELYMLDGEYVVVSTCDLSAVEGATERAILDIASLAGSLIGHHMPSHGEETIAFPADESGNFDTSTELAKANGPGSRRAVIDKLAA